MPELRHNPLDCADTQKPYISLLVHSESLKTRILNGSILCEQLFGLLEYDAVGLCLSPTMDPALLAKAAQNRWPVAEWHPHQGFINISQGRTVAYDTAEITRLANTPFIPGSKYSHLDNQGILRQDYHFMILEEDDTIFDSKKKPDKVIKIHQALDFVRLVLVCHGYFRITREWYATEFEYYAYRFCNYFKHIAWLLAYTIPMKGNSELNAFIDSLRMRFELWCRAVDGARIYSMRTNLADKFQRTLYDFNYYVLLTTGIFENLAWIINYSFKMGFGRDQSQKIGLRNSNKNQKTFLSQIPSTKLKDFLTEGSNQNSIELFYDLREEIAHNIVGDGHTATRHGIFDDGTRLEIPAKAAERLKILASEEYWGLNHNSLFPAEQTTITTHKFCEFSSTFLRRFVNLVLREVRVNVEQPLTDEVRKSISKNATDFCTTWTKMGNFQGQPYYFCPEMFFDNCY